MWRRPAWRDSGAQRFIRWRLGTVVWRRSLLSPGGLLRIDGVPLSVGVGVRLRVDEMRSGEGVLCEARVVVLALPLSA